MKKTICLLSFIGISLLIGCANGQGIIPPKKNILIVYLSRTGNTETIAQYIQHNVGGKLVALKLVTPYPKDYRTTVNQVAKENETGFLPRLETKIDSIPKFDIVFLGFPTWGMQLPPPMKSFLTQHDLRGKTVIPFNTNGGYGVGSSFETVKKLCTGCKILEGFVTRGGSERDGELLGIKGEQAKNAQIEVRKWLQKIKMTE